MSHPVVTVDNLSKAYRIGAKEEVPDTIVGAITGVLRSPWKNARKLRQLSSMKEGDEADDILWALKDVSFEINEGEVVGIIGRNGAGKSTLLKILSRITEPTGGRAVIRGRVSSLLEVGTGFHPELTGRENIYMNGTILGMTKREIDRKFDEIVDFSGVEKFLDTPTKRYSSGMQVRLAFAVAAHLEPEILIIDEVLAVGDAEFQKKCLGKMKDVAGQGRTVLFVSHNMVAVEALCSRGIALTGGQLNGDGPSGEVIAKYLSATAANGEAGGPASSEGVNSVIREVTVCNRDERLGWLVRPGDDLLVTMRYRSDAPIVGGRFTCRIDSASGAPLTLLQSEMTLGKLLDVPAEADVECVVPNLQLLPGAYTMNVVLHSNGKVVDRLAADLSFTVEEGDFYGTGRMPRQAVAFLSKPTWRVTPLTGSESGGQSAEVCNAAVEAEPLES